MALTSGACLGPYEIVSALGAGGMGAVYRARDTKRNRDVASKVLPASFANDADRLARLSLCVSEACTDQIVHGPRSTVATKDTKNTKLWGLFKALTTWGRCPTLCASVNFVIFAAPYHRC